MTTEIIELQGISKSFKGNLVLNNIDLKINRGEIISFIGENGSGKSTLIKMIAGLIYQDKGIIKINGIDNHNKKAVKRCEYVFESGQGFYGYLTAHENIRYFLGLNKVKFKSVINEYETLCNQFNFHQYLNKKVDELSQGNRQKMALITSLLSHPEILILDEPTNGLDEKSIDELSNILISKNKEEKLTVLATSHDTEFINKINSKIVLVENKIIKEIQKENQSCGTTLK